MRLSKKSLFAYAFLGGLILMSSYLFLNRPGSKPRTKALQFSAFVCVTEQINEAGVATAKREGFRTIIDLRPDGEAPDQTPSQVIQHAAHSKDINFSYIPVPHGAIPDSAVTALARAISQSPQPILVYCRSGRRAARTLGLVEASRPGGPDAATILAMVHSVGQSADDLGEEINRRIAQRTSAERVAQ